MKPWLPALLLLAGCAGKQAPAVLETVVEQPLTLAVEGQGELKSARATPLKVPGSQWSQRQLEWMLPEGGRVKQGELIARFSATQGKLDLAQAMIDLQRNALARAGKQGELEIGGGKIDMQLAQVAVQLGIAQRYADADLDMFARNEILDAIQDERFLGAKQNTLLWKRGQSGQRGSAELAVLDAQRATFDLNAKTRRSDLDALELRAPHDGVLMLSENWTGEKAKIGATMWAGMDFGSLPDASRMELELALPQMEARGVQVGDAIQAHPVGRPEQVIHSKLLSVASAAKVRSRESPAKYLTMKAPMPAAAVRSFNLVPGQRLRARIVLQSAKQAISVPNIALSSDDGKDYVRVRNGDGYERREVKLGARGPARSQVHSGLKPGDQILLTGGGEGDR